MSLITQQLINWTRINNSNCLGFFAKSCMKILHKYQKKHPSGNPSNYVWKIFVTGNFTKFSKTAFVRAVKSTCSEVFCEKGVLKNFTKFKGKRLCRSLFFNKVKQTWGLRSATLLKKRLQRICFLLNFAKFCKARSFIGHLLWLLLVVRSCFQHIELLLQSKVKHFLKYKRKRYRKYKGNLTYSSCKLKKFWNPNYIENIFIFNIIEIWFLNINNIFQFSVNKDIYRKLCWFIISKNSHMCEANIFVFWIGKLGEGEGG